MADQVSKRLYAFHMAIAVIEVSKEKENLFKRKGRAKEFQNNMEDVQTEGIQ